MINLIKAPLSTKTAIFCFSEMLGEFAPTQWGTFDSFAQAEEFAAKNIKHTNFKVDFVG